MSSYENDINRKSRKQRRLILALFIFIFYGASSLAANITINTNNRVEFGQGVYYLTACDNYIPIYIGKTENTFLVDRIYLDGINTVKCRNRIFTLRLRDTNGNSVYFFEYALNENQAPDNCPSTSLLLSDKITFGLNPEGDPYLITADNKTVGTSSCDLNYQELSVLDRAKGKFLITLKYPTLAANSFGGLTIESS